MRLARATKIPSRSVFDLATLKETRRTLLRGIGLDVAGTPGGQIAAAVGSKGSSKLVLVTEKQTSDLDLGIGWRAAHIPGYIEYSPDAKLLFVSGHPGQSGSYPNSSKDTATPAGLDVYDVSDPDAPGGLKKKASIRTANQTMVGGHFLVSPGAEFLVFHSGAVVETANLGGNNGEGAVGGFGGGNTGFPGGGVVPPAQEVYRSRRVECRYLLQAVQGRVALGRVGSCPRWERNQMVAKMASRAAAGVVARRAVLDRRAEWVGNRLNRVTRR